MKSTRFILGSIAAAMMLSGAALGNEIYKWVDADGNVHYRDTPSGGPPRRGPSIRTV